MYIAISSGGIYRTADGGESWSTCTNGPRVNPDVPGATLCPHKIRFDPENPARLYLQNHPGVYRTDNDARFMGGLAAAVGPDSDRWIHPSLSGG
jgi:hypothetical protein